MELSVKLASALTPYRPADEAGNRFAMQMPADSSVADLLAQLGIPAGQPLMVIADGSLVATDDFATHRLSAGGTISLTQPIHAG